MMRKFSFTILLLFAAALLQPAHAAETGGAGAPAPSAGSEEGVVSGSTVTSGSPRAGKAAQAKTAKRYLGHKVSLDLEEANIKNVFRLLSEVSGINIVAGEDVKGSVTVRLRNVPWDQALETILETNGLGMKRTGSVISVFPLDKIKKAEEERLKEDIAQGRKTQIAIEAKIVETTSNYSRKLGVQWSGGYAVGTSWIRGGGGLMPQGLTPYPGGIGVVRDAFGGAGDFYGTSYLVNLDKSYTSSPSIGLLIGGSKAVLDAQLTALEGTGDIKVISSPKVTTLDNVKSYIKQGQSIPIITKATTTEPVKVEYKEAVLQLAVTPTLTPDGRLSLKILATNDAPDYATQAAMRLDNPPINKSEVEATVLVQDGETIVVGGIKKVSESTGESGIPWLRTIPVLGWIFKAQEVTKDRRELLIFLTPKIVPDPPKKG